METGKEAQRGKSLPKEYKWEGRWAKREKKKGNSYRGNNNSGEIGD
jgi:hypothetical protein